MSLRQTHPMVPSGAPDVDAAAAALEAALRDLTAEHETLHELARKQKEAVASADPRALAECAALQRQAAERITAIEYRRREAAQRIVLAAEQRRPAGAETLTVSTLVRHLSENWRQRIVGAAESLRETLRRLHAEHSAIGIAVSTLATHMDGLMKQVARGYSHAGTYSRGAVVLPSGVTPSSIDVRT